MNVIFLLMGMMIIVGVLKKTGMFQWLAYQSYALAKGNIFVLAGILMVATVMVLWVSAIACAFNRQHSLSRRRCSPIVAFLNTTIPGAESGILWWSLALGACQGEIVP